MSTWEQIEDARRQLKGTEDTITRIDSGLVDYVESKCVVFSSRAISIPNHIQASILAMLRSHYEDQQRERQAELVRLCHEFGVAESEVKP